MRAFVIFVLGFSVISALKQTCDSDSDCVALNAECRNSTCDCGDLYYYNGSICLPYATEYKSICYEDEQCSWLGDNSGCRNNRCLCLKGYRWYQGACQKYVGKGESCQSDVECYNGYDLTALTCTGNVCQCSTGYYDRGQDCRYSSAVLGDCALNNDCRGLIPSRCKLGKCVVGSSNKTEEVIKQLRIKITAPQFATISYVSSSEKCSSDTDCNALSSNTMCFMNSTCICKPGFFLWNGTCIGELGVSDPHATYASDKDCPIKPGRRKDKHTCLCKNYWFNDDTNRNCIKTTLEQTRSCLTNEWCRAMGPYSFCNSSSGQCECLSVATLNTDSFYCEISKDVDVSDLACVDDTDCPINEKCADSDCQCVENFARVNGVCLPNIGASCSFRSCNHIGNSTCVDDTCQCNSHFIANGNRCLAVVDSLNSECQIDAQCRNLQHSVCKNSTYGSLDGATRCVCADNYVGINGTCRQIRGYGDVCANRLDCTVILGDTFQCRNNICQCPVGFSLNEEDVCVASSSSPFLPLPNLILSVIIFIFVCRNNV